MSGTYFRTVQVPGGTEYLIDNVAVSKEEFDKRSSAAKKEMQDFNQQRTPGLDDLEDFAVEARKRMQQRMTKKSGGKIKASISTHKKSSKSPSW